MPEGSGSNSVPDTEVSDVLFVLFLMTAFGFGVKRGFLLFLYESGRAMSSWVSRPTTYFRNVQCQWRWRLVPTSLMK